MITIFCTPKNFEGIFNIIQTNAIRSWRYLSEDVEIIIFGKSEGAQKIANEVSAIYFPDVKCSKNGVPILSDQTLPSHNVMKNRRITLPPGGVGYNPQLQSTFQGSLSYQFETIPDVQFSDQQLYHFYEVTFTGTVELQLYVDEVEKAPNNSENSSITLIPRDSRNIDTRRVYFPPLTYGWIPQLKQVVDSTKDSQVLSNRIRALPSRFFKGEREHSEIQVTHQGPLELEVFLDGKLLAEYRYVSDKYNDDAFKTEKEYLPSSARGQILQWIQSDGAGEVASFESDLTLTDREQPQTEV